ncbi:uncharacterized protein LOC116262332 isoform X2 [Nymphaea colorata]|uniref:uncharacterized protein LOC116262332 isoform X2 n=1 Tax=Nymphaea colorata TaxID=210225 RepID=UPI00129ED186|nr:uncharacterized protein LOC116262332 isoform X2 [Nymphaea colorata]
MGGEKRDNKGAGPGGFFQLFDRNGKSRWKKLFSSKSSAADESEQAKLDGEKLQTTNFHMMDDEKRSECSYPSSLSVDEEGVGVKAPSVVARLMGLESLPSVDVPEASSTPFHDSRLVNGSKKCLEFASQYQNLPSVRQSANLEILPCKIVVPRPQKLQKMSFVDKRPIERFQTEPLPGKPVKSYSDIQHRLLSPIKSSGFVSAKSAAHLMETAAKILEPGLHPAARTRSTLVGTSSISLKDRGRSEDIISSCRISRPLELPKKFTEPNAVKVLSGQPMNKSWNGSDGSSSSRTASEGRTSKNLSSSSSQNSAENNQKPFFSSTKREKQVSTPHSFLNCEDSKPAFSSNQGKSISLAVQAKVNVQRRESLSCSSLARPNNTRINSLLIHDAQDEPGLSRQRKSQLNLQKNKQKQAISSSANVLRQNNQKQNRLPSKCAGVNQHTKKGMAGGNSSPGQKLANHDHVRDHMASRRNPCSQPKKGNVSRTADKGVDKSDIESKKCLSRTSDFPRKKRSIEGSFCSEKNGVVGTIFIDERDRTPRDTISVTTGYTSQVECNKRNLWNGEQAVSSSSKSMDVVSFTFTSPLASTAGSRSADLASNKQNIKKGCIIDSLGEKNVSNTKSSRMSAPGSMNLGGESLSVLLEKKLRELTSGIQMASSLKATNSGNANTVSILQDFLATLNSGVPISKEHDAECLSMPHDNDVNYRCIDETDCSSSSTPMVNTDHKFEVQESVSEQNSEAQKGNLDLIKMDAVEDNERLSPVSILDAAFSNDSYNSVDSSDGVYGGQLDQSCQPCIISTLVVAADKDLLDSATSACTPTVETPGFSEFGLPDKLVINNDQELEYVRDIVFNIRLTFEDVAVGSYSGIVDPLLFDRLESNSAISASVEDEKHIKIQRRLCFDCVCECVDSKYGCYSRGDCRSWTKGAAVVGKADVVNEIFKEMLGWRSMGELMVDEILYKDMSTGTGRWLDYENEEFETGLEVEEDILDSLIEEVVIYTFGLEP